MKHGEDCADKVLEQWGWDDRKTGDSNPFYGWLSGEVLILKWAEELSFE